MQDAYMIGNNATFSSAYGTVCTEDYGDCGLVLNFSDHASFTRALLDVITARVHFKISLPGWTSSKIVCLLMAGNEVKQFGQFPKHSAMTGSLASLHMFFSRITSICFIIISFLWLVIETKLWLHVKVSYCDLERYVA
jgi:hypothetical protein